jgi:pimeloyl-ACP methyl ester carboxylesterase
MGGQVVLQAAVQRPRSVAAIVGVDTFFDFYSEPFDTESGLEDRLAGAVMIVDDQRPQIAAWLAETLR